MTAASYNFSRHTVIGWDEPARIVASDWIAAHVPARPHRLSQQQPRESAHGGTRRLGIALLPCYLADADGGVRRISGVLPDLASELWIVTHQDLRAPRASAHSSAVIGDAIVTARRSFEGRT